MVNHNSDSNITSAKPPPNVAGADGTSKTNGIGVGLPVPALHAPLSSNDWSANLPATAHVQFFRATDWSATPLGPINQWSLALRIHVFTVFADSHPACVYWGRNKVAIYNEPFGVLAVGRLRPIRRHCTDISLGRCTSRSNGPSLSRCLS